MSVSMTLWPTMSWQLDEQGQRKYRKLNKPKLPNHKLFDPENENQREDYYYSLVLLFCPFRYESTLLHDNETAEAAFNRLVSSKSSHYHAKLKVMLSAAARESMRTDSVMVRRK